MFLPVAYPFPWNISKLILLTEMMDLDGYSCNAYFVLMTTVNQLRLEHIIVWKELIIFGFQKICIKDTQCQTVRCFTRKIFRIWAGASNMVKQGLQTLLSKKILRGAKSPSQPEEIGAAMPRENELKSISLQTQNSYLITSHF